ncbi:MAG TPA: UDP-N-acetylglucosamine 2-epimerase (non-hydrolyzing) [Gaiellaceae bacterium]|nr:UDP-N-acetylglucosamine 2-epimerase (non-hydrolyzing) [Gaiellaceae bacterium]
MKVLTVVGNRPQFIKSGPLSEALRAAGIEEVGLHTGQHWDRALSAVFYEELGLPEPRYSLDLHSADPEQMRPRIAAAIERERPDWVVVFGDTNSTLAGAEAALDAGIEVAHVEAGLRSGDLSMPEERNRIAVDRVSALLLCPDDRSAQTLRGEDVPGRIDVVGDVMRDALDLSLPFAKRAAPDQPGPYALLTIHREANTEPERLRRLISELNGAGWTFVFPVHPRTRHVLDENGIRLSPEVRATEPQGYLELLALASGASRIVTDSGGLQKEAYWLGIPCVTLRANTEWVDTVEAGANTLVDPDDPSNLRSVLHDAAFPADAPQLYGDGHAAVRVAASLRAA